MTTNRLGSIIGFWMAILIGSVFVLLLANRPYSNQPLVDPAITEMQEVGYTNIDFTGDRYGYCNKDLRYVKALVNAKKVPKIERSKSYDKTCTFSDNWVATNAVGNVETGDVLCGPALLLVPPYKFCIITEDRSKP